MSFNIFGGRYLREGVVTFGMSLPSGGGRYFRRVVAFGMSIPSGGRYNYLWEVVSFGGGGGGSLHLDTKNLFVNFVICTMK